MIIGLTLAWAFAEEPIGWRDPATGVTYPNTTISTIHDDLTYLLALAAGFSITDAKTLQVWDQLVDSEALPGAVVSYTNGGGAYYPSPNASDVCTNPIHSKVIWPRTQDMVISTSITSRYGQYSPFFHFPHQSGPMANRDLGALSNWATGVTTQLVAYEAYAWGGPADFTVFQAKCLYTRTAVITTNIAAGSLPAFATYVHSLGDSYSHLTCIQAMDALGYPWASHSQTVTVVPPCYYPVNNPGNNDAHGEEFGVGSITDSMRTDAAVRAIYSELITRSLQREGQYMPIGLGTLLALSITETFSFSDTLYQFVHNWNYDQPIYRREWADKIASALLAQRVPLRHIYLPIVLK
jgi:hypothetical protein